MDQYQGLAFASLVVGNLVSVDLHRLKFDPGPPLVRYIDHLQGGLRINAIDNSKRDSNDREDKNGGDSNSFHQRYFVFMGINERCIGVHPI